MERPTMRRALADGTGAGASGPATIRRPAADPMRFPFTAYGRCEILAWTAEDWEAMDPADRPDGVVPGVAGCRWKVVPAGIG